MCSRSGRHYFNTSFYVFYCPQSSWADQGRAHLEILWVYPHSVPHRSTSPENQTFILIPHCQPKLWASSEIPRSLHFLIWKEADNTQLMVGYKLGVSNEIIHGQHLALSLAHKNTQQMFAAAVYYYCCQQQQQHPHSVRQQQHHGMMV